MNEIDALKKFVLANYNAGGHWIYETYSSPDYAAVLEESKSLSAAKKELKVRWELQQEMSDNCSF